VIIVMFILVKALAAEPSAPLLEVQVRGEYKTTHTSVYNDPQKGWTCDTELARFRAPRKPFDENLLQILRKSQSKDSSSATCRDSVTIVDHTQAKTIIIRGCRAELPFRNFLDYLSTNCGR
jgi:hypothetical protein